MGQRLAAAVVACVAAVGSMTAARASDPDPIIQTVLHAFEDHGHQTIDAFLMSLRPAPLEPADRSQVLVTLPNDDVRPSRSQIEKIAAAQRVLDYSDRKGAIAIRPIIVDAAFVGLYFRAVVLASTRTLDILNAEEFAALVAHEVGHDYHWNGYWTAIEQHDVVRLRELELWSDGIAVLTLERIGIDSERLASAVEKQTHYNQVQDAVVRAGMPAPAQAAADRYVPLSQRVAFIRAIARLPWGRSGVMKARPSIDDVIALRGARLIFRPTEAGPHASGNRRSSGANYGKGGVENLHAPHHVVAADAGSAFPERRAAIKMNAVTSVLKRLCAAGPPPHMPQRANPDNRYGESISSLRGRTANRC
jgi:hypothetical protein